MADASIVERVAKAIFASVEEDEREWETNAPWDSQPTKELCEWERDDYRAKAKAAIGEIGRLMSEGN